MADGNVSVQVGQDLIKPIIEAKIHSAIIEGLGNQRDLVAHAVARILQQKVNSAGNVTNSRYDEQMPMIDWLCVEYIKIAAKELKTRKSFSRRSRGSYRSRKTR